jgi:hypothetical protein
MPGPVVYPQLPVTTVHALNEDVLPFFEQHQVQIQTILSDNGREYFGRPDRQERLHRSLLDEHFRVISRTK